MFGSIYAPHLEILRQSLSEMNEQYTAPSRRTSGGIIRTLQSTYIRLFGIPEIGFQVRGMYFRRAMGRLPHEFRPKRILDAGSGIGSYTLRLASMYPHAYVEGWEIDRKKLAFTQKFAKDRGRANVHFAYGDIVNGKSKAETYDLIVTVDVLEHIKEYKKALANLTTLLGPGGYLYVHVPQVPQYRFFRRFETWEHKDHAREGFRAVSLKNELEDLGFSIVSLENSFGFFGSLAWELHHLLLSTHFVLAALFYPLLWVFSLFDGVVKNDRGLAVAILASKG